MHKLLHIYGPIGVYSYGLVIAVGLFIFTVLIKRNKVFQTLGLESIYAEALFFSIIGALVGGRLVFMISHPQEITSLFDFCAVWQGGYSILGNIFGVLVALPAFLWYHGKPIIKTLDIAAIYIPLLQSISRLGCLAAGCCYGTPTTVPWAIRYQDPESVAPLCVYLHPTQLYSSLLLFIIFLLMFFYLQKRFRVPGQLTCSYLALVALERCIVDFWRGDRVFLAPFPFLSIHQLIALGIFGAALIGLIILSLYPRRGHEHL